MGSGGGVSLGEGAGESLCGGVGGAGGGGGVAHLDRQVQQPFQARGDNLAVVGGRREEEGVVSREGVGGGEVRIV